MLSPRAAVRGGPPSVNQPEARLYWPSDVVPSDHSGTATIVGWNPVGLCACVLDVVGDGNVRAALDSLKKRAGKVGVPDHLGPPVVLGSISHASTKSASNSSSSHQSIDSDASMQVFLEWNAHALPVVKRLVLCGETSSPATQVVLYNPRSLPAMPPDSSAGLAGDSASVTRTGRQKGTKATDIGSRGQASHEVSAAVQCLRAHPCAPVLSVRSSPHHYTTLSMISLPHQCIAAVFGNLPSSTVWSARRRVQDVKSVARGKLPAGRVYWDSFAGLLLACALLSTLQALPPLQEMHAGIMQRSNCMAENGFYEWMGCLRSPKTIAQLFEVKPFVKSWLISLVGSFQGNISAHRAVVWIMGEPAGFKLNKEVSAVLGQTVLRFLHAWDGLVYAAMAITPFLLPCAVAVSTFLGLGTSLAFVADCFWLVGLQWHILYRAMCALYGMHFKLLGSLFRIFRGKKINPLRNRVDGYDFTTEQWLLGTVALSVLLFTLPTTLAFHLMFSGGEYIMDGLASIGHILSELVPTFPLYTILHRMAFPASFNRDVDLCINESLSVSADVVCFSLISRPVSFGEIVVPWFNNLFSLMHSVRPTRPLAMVFGGKVETWRHTSASTCQ